MKVFWYSILGFMGGIIFAVVFWAIVIPMLNWMLR
jgi:hypothetical protein